MSIEYDVVVIGGGSGGLACSKQLAKTRPGAKIAVFDFIKPTPLGTTWGLGGTCVNVGCIPKKLFHYSGLLGQQYEHARTLGWKLPTKIDHDWKGMVSVVDGYIKALNFNYKKELSENHVNYINSKSYPPHVLG